MMSGLVQDGTTDPAVQQIDCLRVREPARLKTAVYGRLGRRDFSWARVDATIELLAKAPKVQPRNTDHRRRVASQGGSP
jgi:hypothetical protein